MIANGKVAYSRPKAEMGVVFLSIEQVGAAVLTLTDMPFAGPRTPNNLRLLLIASAGCAVLIAISLALGTRPLGRISG